MKMTDNTPLEFEPLLTKEEVANHLRISPDAVYELTRPKRNGDRVLPSYRIGRVLRFRLSQVNSWLEKWHDRKRQREIGGNTLARR